MLLQDQQLKGVLLGDDIAAMQDLLKQAYQVGLPDLNCIINTSRPLAPVAPVLHN